MAKRTIAVIGGTGWQGGGLVDALLERGEFAVRVLTRNPDGEKARALAAKGVEVVRGDLNAPNTLPAAFAGAYGVFAVTNFWESGTAEFEQGKSAAEAAKAADVEHYVWSTLANVKEISGGALEVMHFTSKAMVDPIVEGQEFPLHTFVEAPFYFHNLTTVMQPQPLEGGVKGWAVPMDLGKECMHGMDITEFGKVVARVFEQPEKTGKGGRLGVAASAMSWNSIVETLRAQGHDVAAVQVPAEAYDHFYPGAKEMREMFQWFEGYGYFGPETEAKIASRKDVYPDELTSLDDWARANFQMPRNEGASA